jgi:hypothetical protein
MYICNNEFKRIHLYVCIYKHLYVSLYMCIYKYSYDTQQDALPQNGDCTYILNKINPNTYLSGSTVPYSN